MFINRHEHNSTSLNGEDNHQQALNQSQLTMSDIAARLRYVHRQMQAKRPLEKVTPSKPAFSVISSQMEWQTVHTRLDEISKAILAEYHARREAQMELVARLERIESQKIAENKPSEDPLPLSDILQELEINVCEKVTNSLDEHSNKLTDMAKKNNEEIVRQLRELTEAPCYLPQLNALESQISNLQKSLVDDEKPETKAKTVVSDIRCNILNDNKIATAPQKVEANALEKVLHHLAKKNTSSNSDREQAFKNQTINTEKNIDAEKTAAINASKHPNIAHNRDTLSDKKLSIFSAHLNHFLAFVLSVVVVLGFISQLYS